MAAAVTLRKAGPEDAARLNAGLRALSQDMGDTHRADDRQIARALGGVCRAIMAEAGSDLAGLALYSPLISTTRGMAGAYVSDLWVAPGWRGVGLGPRLLASVRDAAARDWDAGFLRLGVYTRNRQARRFYHGLGFTEAADEHYLTLTGPALEALKGAP